MDNIFAKLLSYTMVNNFCFCFKITAKGLGPSSIAFPGTSGVD